MEIFRKRCFFRAFGADSFSDPVLRSGHQSPVQSLRRSPVLLAMVFVQRLLHGHYLFLASMTGAVFHNLGQIGVAFLLTSVPAVLVYLPFLLLSGLVTGLFIGLCAHFTLRFLP